MQRPLRFHFMGTTWCLMWRYEASDRQLYQALTICDQEQARRLLALVARQLGHPAVLRWKAAESPFVHDSFSLPEQELLDELARCLNLGQLVLCDEGDEGYQPRPGLPGGQKPSIPPILPKVTDGIVHPIIDIPQPIVLVRKPNVPCRRQHVYLRTDEPFDGTGALTCSQPATVELYRSPEGGQPLLLGSGPVEIPGAQLTAGLVFYAQGVQHSGMMDDIELRLSLRGGTKQRGPDDTATMTSIELTVLIRPAPDHPGGWEALPHEEKTTRGCFLHVNSSDRNRHRASDQQRSKLEIERAKPASFPGRLVLRGDRSCIQLLDERTGLFPVLADPVILDNQAIPPAGVSYYVEAARYHRTELTLGIEGVTGVGDLVIIEVMQLSFLASPSQRYGFDDMDFDPDSAAHVSVARGGDTVVRLAVDGAAHGDVVQLINEKPVVATVPERPIVGRMQNQLLDLPIHGAPWPAKEETRVEIRRYGPQGPICATLGVHVYAPKRFRVYLLRVYDPRNPTATKVTNAIFTIQEAEQEINRILKQVVAEVEVFDLQGNAHVPIAYDANQNGKLERDARGTHPSEANAFSMLSAMYAMVVVYIKDIVLTFGLERNAADKATMIRLYSDYEGHWMDWLRVGNSYHLGWGPKGEQVTIDEKTKTVLELKRSLQHAHAEGETLIWDIGGMSGRPTFVEDAPKDLAIYITAHEIAHTLLGLADVEDEGNLMYAGSQQRLGRLRYKEVSLGYDRPGYESQWEKIPR